MTTKKILLVYAEEDTKLYVLDVNDTQLELLKQNTGRIVNSTELSEAQQDIVVELLEDLGIPSEGAVDQHSYINIETNPIKYVFTLGWYV